MSDTTKQLTTVEIGDILPKMQVVDSFDSEDIESTTLPPSASLLSTLKKTVEQLETDLEEIDLTTEKVTTTDSIPVAGGPLADLLNKEGITEIDPSTDLQSLLMTLFAKEKWPASLAFKDGSISSSIAQPSFTLTNSGNLVEVGTTLTASAATLSASTYSTSNRTYSGFTYGYSAENDNSKDSTSTSITVTPSSVTSVGANYTMSRTINGTTTSATPSATATAVTLAATTFEAKEGTNTVKVSITGTNHKAIFAAMPVYYACSNFGNTSADHASTAQSESTKTSIVPSNSKTLTVTGVYPYFATTSSISECTKQTLTTSKTVTFTAPEETSANKQAFEVKGTVSKVELYNTLSGKWESDSLGNYVVSTVTETVGGKSVEYAKYTRNAGINGSTQFRITYA